MKNLTKEEKSVVMDCIGEMIVKKVRDPALKIPMDLAHSTSPNPIKTKQYAALSNLTQPQQDAVCDLLSETVTDAIYLFLELFEEKSDKLKLYYVHNGEPINVVSVSEKMGSEIACYGEEGWIQKYSQIGRFVL